MSDTNFSYDLEDFEIRDNEYGNLNCFFVDCDTQKGLDNNTAKKESVIYEKSDSEYSFLNDSFVSTKTATQVYNKKNEDLIKGTAINSESYSTEKSEYDSILGESFIVFNIQKNISNKKKLKVEDFEEACVEKNTEKCSKSEYDTVLEDSFEAVSDKSIQKEKWVIQQKEKEKSEYDNILSDLFD